MNTWYFFAILFSIGVLYCGYKGNEFESNKSNSKINDKLSTIGDSIQELRKNDSSATAASELEEIEEEFYDLALNFYASRHDKAALIEAQRASSKANQLKNVQELESRFERLLNASKKFAIAYTKTASDQNIRITQTNKQQSLSNNTGSITTRINYEFNGIEKWAAQLDITDENPLGDIRFYKIDEKKSNSDSDDFIEYSHGVILTSIQDRIALLDVSKEYKEIISYIKSGLSDEIWEDLDNYDEIMLEVARRLIEWNLLPSLD